MKSNYQFPQEWEIYGFYSGEPILYMLYITGTSPLDAYVKSRRTELVGGVANLNKKSYKTFGKNIRQNLKSSTSTIYYIRLSTRNILRV